MADSIKELQNKAFDKNIQKGILLHQQSIPARMPILTLKAVPSACMPIMGITQVS